MSHTPGKWHAPGLGEVHDERHRVIAICVDCDPVDEHERPSPSLDEGNANARLIAAAPELLAFAAWLLEAYHSDEGMPEARHIAREARAAIAKATGEQA